MTTPFTPNPSPNAGAAQPHSPPRTTFTLEELKKHDGKNGNRALVAVDGDVLDVTQFAQFHPGGNLVLLEQAGRDCTKAFYALHRREVLEKRLARLKVGELRPATTTPTPRTVHHPSSSKKPQSWTDISTVPYAEISMDNSPYYNESHKRFREELRRFLWDNLFEWSDAAEVSGEYPTKELFKRLGASGYLALFAGRTVENFKRIPEPNLWSRCGIKPEEIDQFHLSITQAERTRMMCPGAEEAILAGLMIGIGPVIHFGPQWMQEEVVPAVLLGEKCIALALTEPTNGSDLAATTTTATLTADGTHFIVRGTKKWITGGLYADYFTTLVRTGGGAGGGARDSSELSMLLIERGEGVTVRAIPTDYSPSAGTSLISFEDVLVPRRNLLGKLGQGFKITMHNFNLERWAICAQQIHRTRRVIEECFLWINTREAFGKPLAEQPVVRARLGEMISEYSAMFAWYESLTHRYNTMLYDKQAELGGETALLKFRSTRMAHAVADGAVQLFGGRGITKTGMGKNVSRNQKSTKIAAVYGGSEEILVDLGMKQALKIFPKHARL